MCEQHSTWCTAHLIWICLPPGAKGDALERAASDRTNSLVPKHTYVPWLVVEGIPLLDGYAHLQKFICLALPADTRWGTTWQERSNLLRGTLHLQNHCPRTLKIFIDGQGSHAAKPDFYAPVADVQTCAGPSCQAGRLLCDRERRGWCQYLACCRAGSWLG